MVPQEGQGEESENLQPGDRHNEIKETEDMESNNASDDEKEKGDENDLADINDVAEKVDDIQERDKLKEVKVDNAFGQKDAGINRDDLDKLTDDEVYQDKQNGDTKLEKTKSMITGQNKKHDHQKSSNPLIPPAKSKSSLCILI